MSEPRAVAATLLDAADRGVAVPSFAAALSIEDAYAAQALQREARLARGERLLGLKLGLTSQAKQRTMNVHEPVRGFLTDAMQHPGGEEPLDLGGLIHPRVEPELAFLIARDLRGPGCSAAEVLAATAAVTVGLEVIDSRYADFRFTLPDVVADDTSAARFVLGPQLGDPALPLDLLGVVLRVNGRLAGTATGAALLGHPAAAVAWAVNHLGRRGEHVPAGSVVLAGAPMDAVPLAPGDVVEVTAHELGTARIHTTTTQES